MKNQYIISNKRDLAIYIKESYKKIYKEDITPLKLQKSMYFLFGLWIVEQLVANETDELDKHSYLFKTNFEAWQYGPVDPEIYHEDKDGKLKGKEVIFTKKVNEFIDEKLKEIFKVSDFTLVHVTHNHESWKSTYTKDLNLDINPESIATTFIKIANEK